MDIQCQESLDLTFSLSYISISSIVSSMGEILSFISCIMLMSLISDVRFEFQVCHFIFIFALGKRLYFSLQLISSITKESKTAQRKVRTQSRAWNRTWSKGNNDCFPLACCHIHVHLLLLYHHDHLHTDGTPHNGLGTPKLTINHKYDTYMYMQTNLWRNFLNFPFQDDSRLYQVNKRKKT